MSKVSRKARAAAARPGTIAADHRLEIGEKISRSAKVVRESDAVFPQTRRLAEDELAHLPLYVVNTKTGRRACVWRSGDGRWWRRGGAARIQRWPTPDGERAFVIFLHKGANRDDLKFLLRTVERARAGKGIDEQWSLLTSSWADDVTYTLDYPSRRYDDPYTHEDRCPAVTACTEPRCRDRWHEEYGVHTVDEVERKLHGDAGHYSVRVTRALDEPEWTVDVYTDEFYGTPDDVAQLVNDLQWMQVECRRANQPNEPAAEVKAA